MIYSAADDTFNGYVTIFFLGTLILNLKQTNNNINTMSKPVRASRTQKVDVVEVPVKPDLTRPPPTIQPPPPMESEAMDHEPAPMECVDAVEPAPNTYQHQHQKQTKKKQQQELNKKSPKQPTKRSTNAASSDSESGPAKQPVLETILAQHAGRTDALAKDTKALSVQQKALSARQEADSVAINDTADNVERLRRCNDVIVRGVPISADAGEAELRAVVSRIAEVLHCSLVDRDVVFANRLSRATGNQILVRFSTPAVRRDFTMRNAGVKGGLTTTMLSPDCPKSERIFISDNLTNRNAAIRKRAATLKHEGHIQLFTIRDGLVHVVVNQNDHRRPVRSVGELNELARCTE